MAMASYAGVHIRFARPLRRRGSVLLAPDRPVHVDRGRATAASARAPCVIDLASEARHDRDGERRRDSRVAAERDGGPRGRRNRKRTMAVAIDTTAIEKVRGHDSMSSRERLEAVLARRPINRVPIALETVYPFALGQERARHVANHRQLTKLAAQDTDPWQDGRADRGELTLFDRYVAQHAKRLNEVLLAHVCLPSLHCHARVSRVLDDRFWQAGYVSTHPVEPPSTGDVNPSEFTRRVGDRLVTIGNLQIGDPIASDAESTRAWVCDLIGAAGTDGGLIVCNSATPRETPMTDRTLANYVALIEATYIYVRG